MQRVPRQGIWLTVATIAGAGIAVIAALMVAGQLRQQQLGEAVAQQTASAERNAQSAREAANRARRAREQAEELVEFFLGELQSELAPIGRVEVYEAAAERTLSYFEALPPDLATPETEASRAAVLATLSQARFDRGDVAGAVRARQSAIDVWRALVAARGENEARVELGFALTELAVLHNANGDTAAGRAACLEALEAFDLAGARSESADVAHGKASAYFGLAEIERLGENPGAALADYGRAAELVDEALEADPGKVSFLSTRMTIHNNAGFVHASNGDLADAEAAYLESLEVARRIVGLDPENLHWKKEVATLLNNLGTLLDEREDYERAEPFLREALAMREALVAWDPRNGRWRADLANSWHNLAMLHYDLGESDAALAESRKALGHYRALATLEPDTAAWADELRQTLAIHKGRLLDAGREMDALALLAETIGGGSKGAGTPGSAWQELVSSLHGEMARLERDSGDLEAAVKGQMHALRQPAEAYQLLPSDDENAYQLGLAYSELGIALREAGRHAEALQPFVLCRYLLERGVPRGYKFREMFLDDAEHDQHGALVATERRPPPPALVPAGATWNYWDRSSYPGDDWAAPRFDDSAWPSGPAKLGYGEGDEATRLDFGDDQNDKNITVWFRTRFEAGDPAAIETLRLNLLRDDGAVLYLNGEEFLRDGMPPGEITPTTRAAFTVMDWEEVIFRRHDLAAGDLPLRAGENLLAVEIHQNEPLSSDLALDLELLPNYTPPTPLEGLDLDAAQKLLGEFLPPKLIAALETGVE